MKLQRSYLPSLALFVALLAFYLGERIAEGTARWVLSGLGVALYLVAAVGGGILRYLGAEGERRLALRSLLGSYGLCGLAFVAYVLQADELGLATGTLQGVLRIVSGALLVLGALPIIAVELSLRSAGDAPQIEGWRIRFAAQSARIVFLSLVVFAGANYAAAQWNRKIDLSYFKTSRVGGANTSLVKNLIRPVHIWLFFPPGNEVLEQARAYAHELAAHSPHVKVEVVDQALRPELARKLKVRSNGYIGIEADGRYESLNLGLDVEKAASMLRKLDSEMHERLIKVLRPPRVAYLTTGHLERDFSPPADDKRAALNDLRQVLEASGFTARRLGLSDGLGTAIPDDATLVIVPGPVEAFLPAEQQALHAYVQNGGRVLFMIDPDHGTTADELLRPYGVQVSSALVATDNLRHLWSIEGQGSSPYNLATNKASSHPTTSTLSKAAGRLAVLLSGAGQVSKRDDASPKVKITFTLRSMEQAFVDLDGNGRFDGAQESKSTVDLGAAVEVPREGGNPGRVVVIGDADFAGNIIVRNQGNYVTLLDAINWLSGEELESTTVEDEKDVRMVHRRDEDRVWFYGSSVVVPFSVLALGLAYSRRVRKQNRKSGGKSA